jgi:hypothetical protein
MGGDMRAGLEKKMRQIKQQIGSKVFLSGGTKADVGVEQH